MWPSWGGIPRGSASISFKDVASLIEDESASPDPSPVPLKRSASVFHRFRSASCAIRIWRSPPSYPKRIVVYFTSLRVVRKTFEDCRAVRSILRGFCVAVDERDLAMDSGFLTELKGILGGKHVTLPIVFIGGRYVGGVDEIRQLHESGEMKRYVDGVLPAEPGVCECCGGFRFVLCEKCSGSRKVYSEKSGAFRSCTNCNENGLIRCPDCCQSGL